MRKYYRKIKEKTASGAQCFGTHCSSPGLQLYEMCDVVGYNYIWIDTEHAFTSPTLISNAGGCAAFVRVENHDMAYVKHILDAGADGIISPSVNTAQEAATCMSMCMYPPNEERGFGPVRANLYGAMLLADYLTAAEDRVIRMVLEYGAKAKRYAIRIYEAILRSHLKNRMHNFLRALYIV